MSTRRILGFAMLLVGTGVLLYGLNASDSVVDQVSNTFRGRFTDSTTGYIIGGAVAAVMGLLMASAGGRSR